MDIGDTGGTEIEFREGSEQTSIPIEDFMFLMKGIQNPNAKPADNFSKYYLKSFLNLNGELNLVLLNVDIEKKIYNFLNNPTHISLIEEFLGELGISSYLNRFTVPLGLFKPVIHSSTSFRNEMKRKIAEEVKDTIFEICLNFQIPGDTTIKSIIANALNSGYDIVGDAVSKVLKDKIEEFERNGDTLMASRLKNAGSFKYNGLPSNYKKLDIDFLNELALYKHSVESLITFSQRIPESSPKILNILSTIFNENTEINMEIYKIVNGYKNNNHLAVSGSNKTVFSEELNSFYDVNTESFNMLESFLDVEKMNASTKGWATLSKFYISIAREITLIILNNPDEIPFSITEISDKIYEFSLLTEFLGINSLNKQGNEMQFIVNELNRYNVPLELSSETDYLSIEMDEDGELFHKEDK